MAVVGLSSPWTIFYRKVEALFKYDPLVHVVYDEQEHHLKLYVDEDEKAEALEILIPMTKEFGNVTMKISIIHPNNETKTNYEFASVEEIFEAALDTNGAFSFANTVLTFTGAAITYVLFRKEVVQFFTDNLADYFGLSSTLYQDIAKDVFLCGDNVYFCTDIKDPVMNCTKQEEWP